MTREKRNNVKCHHYLVSPVILGRKEIPKGTLRNILALLEISHSDFLANFR